MFPDYDDSSILKKYGRKLTERQQKYQNGLRSYPKEILKHELMKFGVKFTYHSNKIEGNPIDRWDSALLFHDRESITPSKVVHLWAVLESVNHQSVFELLLDSKLEVLSVDLIKEWHKLLFIQTKPECVGILRGEGNTWNVKIQISSHIPSNYSEVSELMNDLIHWYRDQRSKLHPVVMVGLFHLRFEQIHPFLDGNGRVGRLLMNKILYDADYPLLNIKFDQRTEYFNILEQTIIQKEEKIFLD